MMEIKGRRVALVGGAGFIGHNLALELKKLGAEVCVIDGLQVNNLLAFSSTEESIANRNLYLSILNERQDLLRKAGIPVYIQDARDYHGLSHLMSSVKPQTVVHLAAVSHANKSNKTPHSTFDHSFRTLENMLDISRSEGSGVEHFVYFSSSMIYGNFEGGFVTEKTPCDPIGIYGALKFGGEKLVVAYNQVFDMPYTIIRPSALYGERCVSRRVGQIFIENALKGVDITLAGDGSDKLDFTYIKDMVNGMVKVISNENSFNQTFNLTYGDSRTLNQMAEIIKGEFPDVTIKYVPKDRLMPDRGTLSVDKAKELVGYDPEWPLEKGFVEYIKWYKSLPSNLTKDGVMPVTYG
ncbi:NAD-dependent epimerase/dehydratase family protein [Maridesulfovibrio zosterae]|uniref:NAD-dependent epimerase/dehydratase family protein n=1 Tax=Maridesulfovibrio zosterae TaxID=82171 RepID=UPI0003FD566B|nr:NAD(P)-dependent oxidoreductase [Maridesulfovibrio zosterae]